MTQEKTKAPVNRTRRMAIAGLALGALVVTGIGATTVASDFGNRSFDHYARMDDGAKGGMGSGMRGKFMEHRLNRLLDSVDATAEQKQKITDIFKKARESAQADRREPGQMREQMIMLLKEPTIDRNAVEALATSRAERMQEVSKIMSNALVDAAEVLTPDQRVKLADKVKDFGPGFGHGQGQGQGHGMWRQQKL